MAVTGQVGAAKPSKVELVPWDPTSDQHFERMVEQRIACGWDYNDVPEWKQKALKGEKLLYWVKLVDDLPNKEDTLKAHFDEFPSERVALKDTATTLGGEECTPTNRTFFPIGHIGLQIGDGRTNAFSLPLPEKAVWIKSVYISFPLHSQGLGRSAMETMERVAARPPLNADLLALDTVESSFQLKDEHLAVYWEGRGRTRPEVPKANQEWYMRQGYRVIKVVQNAFDWVHPVTGEANSLPMVFLSKKLV
ncbi:hypothetical protein NLU13_0733 [Sarocladium strictum]|uniref:Uncharacterized protein n=1 Tax=Sarocladium strictum TaxID=5046 RepID=A0AA39LBK2_SARSR|nr:hypothetical protein NLU13_0733 [Sarocladium strictum]